MGNYPFVNCVNHANCVNGVILRCPDTAIMCAGNTTVGPLIRPSRQLVPPKAPLVLWIMCEVFRAALCPCPPRSCDPGRESG